MAAPTILLGELTGKRTLSAENFQRRRAMVPTFNEPDSGSVLHRWQPGQFKMATSTSSTVQKSGRAVPIIRNTEYSSRTDPDVPKHKGISYFIIPMDIPELTLSPIIDMTTAHSFNQTFFMTFAFRRNISLGKKATGGDSRKSRLPTNGVVVISRLVVGLGTVG